MWEAKRAGRLPSACAPANARSIIRFEPTICDPSAAPDPTAPHAGASGAPLCSQANVSSTDGIPTYLRGIAAACTRPSRPEKCGAPGTRSRASWEAAGGGRQAADSCRAASRSRKPRRQRTWPLHRMGSQALSLSAGRPAPPTIADAALHPSSESTPKTGRFENCQEVATPFDAVACRNEIIPSEPSRGRGIRSGSRSA